MAKNILALTVRIVLALQAYRVKVKPHKPVPTDLELTPQKKAATPVNRVKVRVLEIQTPIHHVASAVVSNKQQEYKR